MSKENTAQEAFMLDVCDKVADEILAKADDYDRIKALVESAYKEGTSAIDDVSDSEVERYWKGSSAKKELEK